MEKIIYLTLLILNLFLNEFHVPCMCLIVTGKRNIKIIGLVDWVQVWGSGFGFRV